jgi:hypothetical protein
VFDIEKNDSLCDLINKKNLSIKVNDNIITFDDKFYKTDDLYNQDEQIFLDNIINKYLLSKTNKEDDKSTISMKFRRDILNLELNVKKVIEIGCNRGHTTSLLSKKFDFVLGIDLVKMIQLAKKTTPNLNYYVFDCYNSDWNIVKKEFGEFDLAFIDCVHEYENCKSDIQNCISLGCKYLIFDDYGVQHIDGVRKAVDEFVNNGSLTILQGMGIFEGDTLQVGDKRVFNFDRSEGVLVRVN